jgi:hypothetical protein
MKKIIVFTILLCIALFSNGWGQEQKQPITVNTKTIKILPKGKPRSITFSKASATLNLNTHKIELVFQNCHGQATVIIENSTHQNTIVQTINTSISPNQIDISSLAEGERYTLKIRNGLYYWEGEFQR